MINYEQNNYYLVTAKCGHVGNRKYVDICFPIVAKSAHDAAQVVLNRPKVKKQLKNAITNVVKIDYDTYLEERTLFTRNDYIKAHYKKQIISYIDEALIMEDVTLERKTSFDSREERISFLLKKNQIKEAQILC